MLNNGELTYDVSAIGYSAMRSHAGYFLCWRNAQDKTGNEVTLII